MSTTATFSSPAVADHTGGVGLGYGIAIAVGILVLISTIMLTSYICIRVKGGNARRQPNTTSLDSSISPTNISDANNASVICMGHDVITIESFPKFIFSSASCRQTVQGPCPICLSEYVEGETLRRVPECKHCFHSACLDEWLRLSATCPLCRHSPVPSAAATPLATPLSEVVPLAQHRR